MGVEVTIEEFGAGEQAGAYKVFTTPAQTPNYTPEQIARMTPEQKRLLGVTEPELVLPEVTLTIPPSTRRTGMASFSQVIDAKTLQQSLMDQGISLPHGADGQWGAEGQNALRSFASQIGLHYVSSSRSGANAVVVPNGLASAVISIGNLKKGMSPTADSSTLPAHVKTLSLQKLLLTLGYGSLMAHGADGRWGTEGRSALAQAAKDYGTINPVTTISGAYPNQVTILQPGQAFSVLVDAAAKGIRKAQPEKQVQVTTTAGYEAQKAAAQTMISKVRQFKQAPGWKLQEVKNFQTVEGRLGVPDGFYGNNTRAAAAWYLGVDVNNLPPVNPAFTRSVVTWTPPAAAIIKEPKPPKGRECKPGTHWNKKKGKCVKDAVAKPTPTKDDPSKSQEALARSKAPSDAVRYPAIDIQKLMVKHKVNIKANGVWDQANQDAFSTLLAKNALQAFVVAYSSDVTKQPPVKDRVLISPPTIVSKLMSMVKPKPDKEKDKGKGKGKGKAKGKGKGKGKGCGKGKHWDKKLKKCVKTKKSAKTKQIEQKANNSVEKAKNAQKALNNAINIYNQNPTPQNQQAVEQAQQAFSQAQAQAQADVASAQQSEAQDVVAQGGITEAPVDAAAAEEIPTEEKPAIGPGAEGPAPKAPAKANVGLIFAALAGVGLIAAVMMKKKNPGLKGFSGGIINHMLVADALLKDVERDVSDKSYGNARTKLIQLSQELRWLKSGPEANVRSEHRAKEIEKEMDMLWEEIPGHLW